MKILLLRLSSLGDIILTQPVIAELERLYPQAEIVFCCKPEYVSLVELIAPRIRILPYRKTLSWHLKLTQQSYDLVVDLHAKFSTCLIRCFIRGGRKVVYNKQRAKRSRIVRGSRDESIESTLRLYFSALDMLHPGKYGASYELVHPKLIAPAHSALSLPLREQSKPLVGIFVGAAHATKAYPLRQLRDFIILTRSRYQIWLLGDKTDSFTAGILEREFSDVTNLCGSFNLAQLAQVVDTCDLIISGDSGPMHLAAALGKKQIAIFGSTHPRLGFSPLNVNARVLCANLECQPCSLHGAERCPLGHFNCMKQITPELLLGNLDGMI